ncbi:hypothetical protein CGRA01v4_06203 [Colletotrichum graminicola]|nr:hypothetical protein CGRA01v4_06203 [Colletotrichum graminicola]
MSLPLASRLDITAASDLSSYPTEYVRIYSLARYTWAAGMPSSSSSSSSSSSPSSTVVTRRSHPPAVHLVG